MFRRNAALVLLFVLLISPSTTFAQQASTSPTPATPATAASQQSPQTPAKESKNDPSRANQSTKA